MRKALLMSCAAFLVPAAVSATPLEDLAGALGVSRVNISTGSAGEMMAWQSAETMMNGDVVFHNAIITADAFQAEVTKLTLAEGHFTGEGLRLGGNAPDMQTTEIKANAFRGEGIEALEIFTGAAATCDSSTMKPSGNVTPTAMFSAQGVELTPPEFSGSDALVSASDMERLRIGNITLRYDSWATEDCTHLSFVDVLGLTAITSGDDTFVADQLSVDLPHWKEYNFQGKNFILTSNTGKRVASVAELNASGRLAGEPDLSIDMGDTLAMFDLMLSAGPEIDVELRGINVDLGSMGVTPTDMPPLKGDLSVTVASDLDTMRFSTSADLEGWFKNRMGVNFNVAATPSDSAKMLMSLKNGDRRIQALGRMSLVNAEFGWKDLGFNQLFIENAGMSLKEAVLMLTKMDPRVPTEMVLPIAEWVGNALTGEAHAIAEPEKPANLADVGVQGVIGIDNVADAIELQLHEKFLE